jgi:hypothetical protein
LIKYRWVSVRATCCAVLFACVVSTVAFAQDVGGTQLIVRIGPAGVHLDPNVSSILVGTLAVGARVPASEVRNGWYRVRMPKAEGDRAAVYGWIPADMMSTASPAPIVSETVTGSAPQDASMYGVLRDLKGQRDRLDRAMQILDAGPDADALRGRRDKIDLAIRALESGSDVPANDLAARPRGAVASNPAALPRLAAPDTASSVPSVGGSVTKSADQVASTRDVVAGRPQTREGFWFNAGMGVGSLGCQNCVARDTGLSGGLSLGGRISDKVLLGIGTTGFAKSIGGEILTVGTLDARLRFYPARQSGFFLTGGIGVGSVSFAGESHFGAGVVLGVGWDIRVARNVSLTPFYNGFAMRSSIADANVGQLGIGITIH